MSLYPNVGALNYCWLFVVECSGVGECSFIETLIWNQDFNTLPQIWYGQRCPVHRTFSQQFILRKCPSRFVRPYAGKVRTHRYLFVSSEKASTTNKQTTLCGFVRCRSSVRLLSSTKLWISCKIRGISTSWLCLWAQQRIQCRKRFLCRFPNWCCSCLQFV